MWQKLETQEKKLKFKMDFLLGIVIGLIIGWNSIQPQFAKDIQTKIVNLIDNRPKNQ